MDIEAREWAVNPPKESMGTLAAMVRDFQWRFPRERRDMVLVFCQEADGLGIAINRACASRDAAGKMHNHQSRVKKVTKQKYADELLAILPNLKEAVAHEWWGGEPFDSLHDVFAKVARRVSGVGPVYLYDVATRVAAHLNISPTSVYLHAGVWDGWLALHEGLHGEPLGIRGKRNLKLKGRIKFKKLPEELQVLTADEVEDFLCTYRSVFVKCLRGGAWGRAEIFNGD